MSFERCIITDPMMWRKHPSPTTGAVLQYFRTDKFTKQDHYTALAARADFKFIVYDAASLLNQQDSYLIVGHGVDVLDKAIAILNQDRRNRITGTNSSGSILTISVADLQFIRAQYVALYGAVNKPPFDVPVI